MKLSRALLLPLVVLLPIAAMGCGSGDVSFTEGSGASGTTSSASNGGGAGGNTGGGGGNAGGSGGAAASNGGGGTASNGGGGAGGSTASNGGGGAGGSGMAVADPNKDGPYTASAPANKTTNGLTVRFSFPTAGPAAGPYPVIVVAHGFQLPTTQYDGYLKRLASFGYVAIAPDFQAGFVGADNTKNTEDLKAGLDWAKDAPELAGKADVENAGATGHSLGGKLALNLASIDPRIKASIVLDPVDGGMGACSPPKCIDVSAKMPMIQIPTGFLGETLDSMAGGFGQACAPAAENFTTFYAGANSPSLQVTVNGANHMSFLDDVASCGFTCNFCNMATLDNATVNALARAYVVSFYERHLRNISGYDTYLTGAKAQELYVGPGIVTIASK